MGQRGKRGKTAICSSTSPLWDIPAGAWSALCRKAAFFPGVTQMQQISFVTLGVALLALIFVCSLIYLRIIKPIARQTAFMASFTQDTRQRIEVTENNEIGEMAQKMNEMLDSIETLNREKLEVQKRTAAGSGEKADGADCIPQPDQSAFSFECV